MVLADWAGSGARCPDWPPRFEHVVLSTRRRSRTSSSWRRRAERRGDADGFLHLAWGEAEIEFALRVHEEDWPLRPALVAAVSGR